MDLHFTSLSFFSGLLALAVWVLRLRTRPVSEVQSGLVSGARPRPRWRWRVGLPAAGVLLGFVALAIYFWRCEKDIMQEIKAGNEAVARRKASRQAVSGVAVSSMGIQERGEAILKHLIETNRYWLRAPPALIQKPSPNK